MPVSALPMQVKRSGAACDAVLEPKAELAAPAGRVPPAGLHVEIAMPEDLPLWTVLTSRLCSTKIALSSSSSRSDSRSESALSCESPHRLRRYHRIGVVLTP